MLSKPIPRWVLLTGCALAATAGWVNAIGLLGAHRQALSHMSGPLTVLGNHLARADLAGAGQALAIVLAFFGGCVLSAMVIRQEALKLGRPYGVVLLLEAGFLLAAWRLLRADRYAGECFAAAACGLQNAMASNYSGAVVRTTHMTGIVTDLGIAFGQALRGGPIDRRRSGLYATLLAGFLAGALAGSVAFLQVGYSALLVPILATGVGGIGCMAWMRSSRAAPLAS